MTRNSKIVLGRALRIVGLCGWLTSIVGYEMLRSTGSNAPSFEASQIAPMGKPSHRFFTTNQEWLRFNVLLIGSTMMIMAGGYFRQKAKQDKSNQSDRSDETKVNA